MGLGMKHIKLRWILFLFLGQLATFQTGCSYDTSSSDSSESKPAPLTDVPRTGWTIQNEILFRFDAQAAGTLEFNADGLVTKVQETSNYKRTGVVSAVGVNYLRSGIGGHPSMVLNDKGGVEFVSDAALEEPSFTFFLVMKKSQKRCYQLAFIKDNPGAWSSGFGFTDFNCSGDERFQFWINDYNGGGGQVDYGEISSLAKVIAGSVKPQAISIRDNSRFSATKALPPGAEYQPNNRSLWIGGYAADQLQIGEFIIFKGELSPTETNVVMKVLQNKWGIP